MCEGSDLKVVQNDDDNENDKLRVDEIVLLGSFGFTPVVADY